MHGMQYWAADRGSVLGLPRATWIGHKKHGVDGKSQKGHNFVP